MRRIARGLTPYVSGARRHAVVLTVISAVGGLAEAVALLVTVRFALSMDGTETAQIELPLTGHVLSSWQAVVLATSCAVAALLAHVMIASLAARVGSVVLASVRERTVRRFADAGWPTQELQREGALQETVTTLAWRVAELTLAIAGGFAQLVMLVIFLLSALVTDPTATIAVVVLGAAIVAALRPLTVVSTRRWQAAIAANSRLAEEVAAMTSTAMESRVFGVQFAAVGHVEQLNSEVRRKHYRASFVSMSAAGLLRDMAVLLLAVCIGVLALSGRDSAGSIGIAIALVIRALASAQAVNGAWHAVVANAPNLDALNARLDELAAGAMQFGSTPIDRLDEIELHHVDYRYGTEVPALSDVTLGLARGESLGVVGPSGSGKSTLVQVLLRLRPPTGGSVTVNGLDYREIDQTRWSALLAFVPQEPTLLEASVADNIRYYRDLPASAVVEAARQANVYDDIMRLPDGFETKLGPRGTGLSGGQKQRVAIARALIGEPQLLVLDEPSSALDVKSELLLRDTLDGLKGRTTIVIVAHRMVTVESCDRILVLQSGRVAQLGTRAELSEVDGFYRAAGLRS